MATRTKYITASIISAGIIGLVTWFFISSHFTVQLGGDVVCAGTFKDPCEWQYNITLTSALKAFYIRHNDAVDLIFLPDVKAAYNCKRDGRFRAAKRANREEYPCGIGWREFTWRDPLTERYKYIEKFTRNKKHEYKLVVFKHNPSDEIKFGGSITKEEFDPKFLPPDSIKKVEECKTTQEVVEKPLNIPVEIFVDKTVCSDEPINLSCSTSLSHSYIVKRYFGTFTDYINTTICKTVGFDINGKLLNYYNEGWNCKRTGFIICCDAPHQSNLDGVCNSGERYVEFDTRDSSREDFGVSPTKQIGDIRIEK